MKHALLALSLLSIPPRVAAQTLDLPTRPATAPTGSALARSLVDLSLEDRERRVQAEVLAGNVPAFLRKLVPITVKRGMDTATYDVAPDYLAVGSDEDEFLVPLTPYTAQAIADRLGCTLPTRKMVDDIYQHAALKLTP